jgi:hypothetical protein
MGKNFHQVLSCELNAPTAEWVEEYKFQFRGLGGYGDVNDIRYFRRNDINRAFGLVALHHLGYDIDAEPHKYLDEGVNVAVDYFCGDWWKRDKDAARALNKAAKNRALHWFGEFINCLLLALLSQRWTDVERICDWVDADLDADEADPDEDQEEGLPGVYKSIAAGLRKRPMPGLEEIELQIRKTRKERPKHLFAAWDAARNQDQQAFQTAITKSLDHFEKKYGRGPVAEDWIAKHQSIVIMAARRLGLKPPHLTEQQQARVICPESIA